MKRLAIAAFIISLCIVLPAHAATSVTSFGGKTTAGASTTLTWKTVQGITSTGSTEVVAAVTGKKIKVVAFCLDIHPLDSGNIKVNFLSAANAITGPAGQTWTNAVCQGRESINDQGAPMIWGQTNTAEALNVSYTGTPTNGSSVSVLYYTE